MAIPLRSFLVCGNQHVAPSCPSRVLALPRQSGPGVRNRFGNHPDGLRFPRELSSLHATSPFPFFLPCIHKSSRFHRRPGPSWLLRVCCRATLCWRRWIATVAALFWPFQFRDIVFISLRSRTPGSSKDTTRKQKPNLSHSASPIPPRETILCHYESMRAR